MSVIYGILHNLYSASFFPQGSSSNAEPAFPANEPSGLIQSLMRAKMPESSSASTSAVLPDQADDAPTEGRTLRRTSSGLTISNIGTADDDVRVLNQVRNRVNHPHENSRTQLVFAFWREKRKSGCTICVIFCVLSQEMKVVNPQKIHSLFRKMKCVSCKKKKKKKKRRKNFEKFEFEFFWIFWIEF